MKTKLNLGCGNDIMKDYVNLDFHKLEGVDVIHDLSKFPYPFKNDYFKEILCNAVIELIDANFIKIMEELHRISKPGAIIKIRSPCFPNPCSVLDPHTKKFMAYNTFDTFIEGASYNYYSKATFRMKKRKFIFSLNPWLRWISFIPNSIKKFYSRFLFSYFPSNIIYYELEVIK